MESDYGLRIIKNISEKVGLVFKTNTKKLTKYSASMLVVFVL